MSSEDNNNVPQGDRPSEQMNVPPTYPGPHYQPPPPPRSGIKWWIPVSIGCGCLILLPLLIGAVIILASLPALISDGSVARVTGEKVALIHVNGEIVSGSSVTGFLGGSSAAGSETIVKHLERARNDSDVKAIVLRVDSPGGSPAASEEIYREIVQVKRVKPIYVSMGDVAASGGYYVSAPCTRIYANGSTLTGSIGVIMQTPNLSGLFKKLGIEPQVVKSGKYKDIGSPSRPMTSEERQMIQKMIDDTFDQFMTAVASGRKMTKNKVKELATGQVFTGRQAKAVGLIDEIGGLREATLAAAKAGGISGEPAVVEYGRRGGLFGFLDEGMSNKGMTAREYDMIVDRIVERLANTDGLGSVR